MAADLTLYGSNADDGTTFLEAGQTYVMTLTQNGQSTSLEFELPAYMTDKIVTSVDMAENKITVTSSFRTGETELLWDDTVGATADVFDIGEELYATLNVAGKYDGNLGTLIGRTVNFQYDTDGNITSFAVDDAEVVYGAMQYVNDTGVLKDGYYKDKITGTKYKTSVNTSSTKNKTRVFAAEDGTLLGFEPATETYQYVKLVLNPDGTVSTANIVDEFPINLYVTEVDGTKVIEDKNHGVDLDGYIIVKDDAYITTDDLELGDVVFVNAAAGVKFADVYNNEVSGEISNVISGKLDLDEKTYTWTGARYYDEDDDEYKTLNTGTDNEKSQNYLNSLDPDEETTAWLNRKGEIRYIAGAETGVISTTDVTYLILENAKSYQESLKDMLKLKVFNGDETEDLVIPMSGLKYYNGDAGTYTTTADDWSAVRNGHIKFVKSDANKTVVLDDTTAAAQVQTLFPAGELMVVTYDATGNMIGLKSHESTALTIDGTAAAGTLDNTNPLGATGSPNLSKGTSVVTTKKNAATDQKWSTGSYTNLWIWNEKGTVGAIANDAFTKVALTDFDNEIITTEHATLEGVSYRADGTKAIDLVVKVKSDSAYKAADTNTINGMIVGTTKKNNSDNTKQVINTITIYGTDGEKATYYGNGTLEAVTDANDGDYVTLTQNKVTGEISAATKTQDWQYTKWNAAGVVTQDEDGALGSLKATREYDSTKLVLANGDELTTTEKGKILLRYLEEGSIKHKVVDYSDVNTIKKDMKVWYNKTYLDSTGTKIQSDMIIVEDAEIPDGIAPSAIVSLNTLPAGAVKFDSTKAIGSAQVIGTLSAGAWKLQKTTDGGTNWADTGATVTQNATTGKLTIGADVALAASTTYRVAWVPTAGGTVEAESNLVTSEAAVATSISASKTFTLVGTTYTAGTSLDTSDATVGAWDAAPAVNDQYGNAFTGDGTFSSTTIAGTADTEKTLSVTVAGGTITAMSFDAALTTGQSGVFSDGTNTITITAA